MGASSRRGRRRDGRDNVISDYCASMERRRRRFGRADRVAVEPSFTSSFT